MGQDDKIKALEAAITKIEKDFGKGAIMKLGDSGNHMNVETVPTGSLSLDVALGLGEDGVWTYFDMVPEEVDIREGSAEYTGRICVIGSKLDEAKLEQLWFAK